MKNLTAFCRLLILWCFAHSFALGQDVAFIQNKGQWNAEVLFRADIPGGDLFITKKGLVYNFIDEEALHHQQHQQVDQAVNAHAIFLNFVDANPYPQANGYQPNSTLYNYYLGNDKTKWASGALAYKKVILKGIYPHVDFEITGVNGGVKTAFIVHKAESRHAIKISYTGADSLFIEDFNLVIKHSLGSVKELPPISYITNAVITDELATQYQLVNGLLQYQLNLPKGLGQEDSLIIDPSVVFSTFSGSVADNFGFTATFDGTGNSYAGGTVYSAGFPTKAGAYQLNYAGGVTTNEETGRDVGILKFSPDGSQLLYATYIGGSNNEQPHSMSCDNSGNLYIMGTTKSANFPTNGGYDNSHNGQYDLFVTCLNPSGSSMLYGTFIGGASDDGFNGISSDASTYNSNAPNTFNYGDTYRGDIRLDSKNFVYIATTTRSTPLQGLPLVNATQNTFGGGLQDGWVLVLPPQLNQIAFSSYIGGSGSDAAFSIRVNGNDFYVAGGTTSNDLPNSAANPLKYKGGVDGYVAKYNQLNLYAHQTTAYLGTNSYDQAFFVSTDQRNQVYVAGQTTGSFAKVGAVYHENNGKLFITVLDANLKTIVLQNAYGPGILSPSAFMVDKCERVYLSGWGGETNNAFNQSNSNIRGFVTTKDAFQRTTDGSDFYMVIFNRNLSSIGYASYFGGPQSQEHVDGGTSHFDENGVVYQSVCAGCGGLSDFPTTVGAYSRVNNGKRPNGSPTGCNNALFKFNARPTPKPPIMRDTTINIIATDSVLFRFDITDENGDSIVVYKLEGNLLTLSPNTPLIIPIINQPGLIRNEFRWISRCENGPDTLRLKLKLKDVACENIQNSEGNITIIVGKTPSPTIDLNCLKRIGNNQLDLSWTPVVQKYLKHISVFRSINNGTFDSLAIIKKPITANNFTDLVNNAATINYCYRLSTINNCGVRSNFSRASCSLEEDNFSPGAYAFAKDSILYVEANKLLSASINMSDNEFNDSMYVNYSGNLLAEQTATFNYKNGAGSANISFTYTPGCQNVGDTFFIDFGVRDNRCPSPIKDKGQWLVVVTPAPPAFSTHLQCLRYLGNNKIGIRWLDNPDTNLTRYQLIKRNNNNTYSTIGRYTPSFRELVEQPADDPFNQEHCYALVAYNTCDIPTDTGDFNCTPWPDSLYPEGFRPHYVSVVKNKAIEITWTHNNALFNELYRMDGMLNNKVLIGKFTSETDTLFVDEAKEVNVQKSRYCYVLETTNDCGLKPVTSPHACSILLEGKATPFVNNLDWSEYNYFNNGVQEYSFSSRDLTQENFVFRIAQHGKNTHFVDESLNKETGIFYYQVAALERNSIYRSNSNMVELRQKPLLHVPNAFTANGDGLNDDWGIVPVFVKEYHLRVYDRWGRLVFETKDKHKRMTANDLDGTSLPCDVYAYVVNYIGFSDESFTKTGNVTILK